MRLFECVNPPVWDVGPGPVNGQRLIYAKERLFDGVLYFAFEEFYPKAFESKYFREVTPPEAMQEQIKELLEEPVLI